MTEPGTPSPSPEPPEQRHGTPSKQHGDPLLAATEGRDEGDGSRQGPSPEPEAPAASG